MLQLNVSNLDTKYTIDTYNTFKIEDEMDMNELEGTYDDYDWTYNNKGYVQYLAELATEYVEGLILEDKQSPIKSFLLYNARSPMYYNYTTDNLDWDIDYDNDALSRYIADNNQEFIEYLKENDETEESIKRNDKQDIYRLTFYLDSLSTEEDYFVFMFDKIQSYDYYTYEKKPLASN